MFRRILTGTLCLVATALCIANVASAQDKPAAPATPPAPPYAAVLKDAKSVPGLLQLHQKGNNLFVELMPGDYGAEYIVLISISRGIAQGPILGGMSWGFGDDWVWQFRKVDDNVHIIRKNVRFKAASNSPEARAVRNSYTDSVLFSIPSTVKGPKGGDLVDLSSVFMGDLPQISQVLSGFVFSPSKSSFAAVKGFENNMELEVAATYASAGTQDIDTVPDSRGVTINVHYSISKIPTGGSYQPRLADDRVGYFLTAVKDFSSKSNRDQFVRYINRWDLQKSDASAKLSPPTKPIKFWIEKTVPYKYEKAIYDGIYEWNKAFEAAGFVNAIVVERQPDNATWDPEDINYNTFRWITSNAGFAMGPSRVNPYTGQILDADIIFDADFLSSWKDEFETFTPATVAAMTGGEIDIPRNVDEQKIKQIFLPKWLQSECALNRGMAMQLAGGEAAILAANADPKVTAENMEKFFMQALKEVTMHEVGHTLGLRHNFKASKWLSLKDLNDPSKSGGAMVASVMDYNPANIVGKGEKQGDYYPTTVGPYDMWAIEYGYKPQTGGTAGEVAELKKIAARSGEPTLAYSTDEDTRGIDPDPDTNRFDLGANPIDYARHRLKMVQDLIPGLVERTTKEGDDYTQARRTFNVVVAQAGQAMFFASRQVGGLKTSRSHKGDKDGKPPVQAVDAKLQREVLDLLDKNLFSDKPFSFPPEIYNQFGWNNWNHWGATSPVRKDFGVHDFVLMWQERVLSQMLSSVTLERMHDAELKSSPDADVLTTAELLDRLTKSIFSDVDGLKEGEYSNRKPAIGSLRRNLQRSYLKSLSQLAMGNTGAPQDCQTVAYLQLTDLQAKIKKVLDNAEMTGKLDTYTRAHLQESNTRIQKVLEARLSLSAP